MSTTATILIFTAIELINVILSTVKSITTINSKKIVAAAANAIYYGFYTIVLIWTVDDTINLWVKIGVTILTNFIGVYLGKLITEKLRKDRIWEIKAGVHPDDAIGVRTELYEHHLHFTNSDVVGYDENANTQNYILFCVYTSTKDDSRKVRDIMKRYRTFTITVNEQNKQL